jgi:hypothetical protein
MLTVVLLLMLPAVLGMSAFRLVQLPRDLRARRAIIHPRRRLLCALASGVVYIALAAYTILVLLAVARVLWTPPETIHDLWAAASVGAGYPLVYLAFEWVLYYSVKPVSRA